LNTPLAGPKAKPRLRLPISGPQVLAGLLGVSSLVFVGWVVTIDDPLGGEPEVIAAIGGRGEPGPGASGTKPASNAASNPAAVPADARTVTVIDGSSGKRQEYVISGSPEKSAGTAVEDRILEGTRHGRIPKVVAGGQRSIEAYASPLAAAQAALKGARIAIVVAGLGVSTAGTADALSRLPPTVTLGFVPYGANLNDLSMRARARGHEVLLQVPMEPFDYPDNDPGPQTLLTTLPTEKNLDRLHWQMSRMQGYVGVM
jgi:hypothetical protein